MITEVEGRQTINDVTLFTKAWKTSSSPVAKLIFIHGFDDHVDRYYELFPTLASQGIEVCGFDQRGWGHSVQKVSDRGLTGPTETVIGDIVSFISTHLPSPVPIFIMGHSMGGAEALVLACNPKYTDVVGQIRGWILESPLIALAKGSEPSFITKFLGRLVARILPWKQIPTGIPREDLSRDPEVVHSLKNDPFLYGVGTLEGLAGMLERADDLSNGRLKLNKEVQSIWIGHGTCDKATSLEASKKWFDEHCIDVEDKELKIYEGGYHQLHADLQKDRLSFDNDVATWILGRVKREVKL
ncbi:putative alpha beta hydrolase [Erysiphe necator]|uniref:Putative alpha beta hydrolase n=1 Tax=Uncinula necator TaxID=52586 RepID=A0A0B1P698_UNCNE|nr:putative alpha beta hydrolase [Erysiphe necator]